VAVLVIDLHFPDAGSLKSKRKELSSIKTQLRGRLGVAVSETGYQDLWQRALISAVTVSGDHSRAEQTLQLVEREAASILGGLLVGTTVEWLE